MSDVILVTGAAGFIGHHLVDHIVSRTPYDVIALDRFDGFSACRRFASERVRTVVHDLRAPVIHAGILEELADSVRYVVNLAADSHVDRSIVDPVGFLQNNAVSVGRMLEYARKYLPGRKVLQMSTDEVYGAAPPGQCFFEGDRTRPTNPYSASKLAGEALCPAYSNTYGMRIVVVRSTNIYGKNQHAEKFIPTAVDKIRRGVILPIHSRDGVPSSRMYLHVSDLCRALMLILENGDVISQGQDRAGYYNVSGSTEHSNLYVAETIAKLLGLPLVHELVEDPPNRPRPDMRYAIGWDRLRELGWTPRVSLEAGLRELCQAALEAA
jgi:dTDP-glucose 4,6-dehydratase